MLYLNCNLMFQSRKQLYNHFIFTQDGFSISLSLHEEQKGHFHSQLHRKTPPLWNNFHFSLYTYHDWLPNFNLAWSIKEETSFYFFFQVVRQLINVEDGKEVLLKADKIKGLLLDIYKTKSERIKRKLLVKGKIPTFLLKLRSKLVYTLRKDRFSYCRKNENWLWSGIGRARCKVETSDYFSIENCVNMCCDYGYMNIPELKTVCVEGPPKQCQVHVINRYFCKYSHEAVKKQPDIPWQDI